MQGEQGSGGAWATVKNGGDSKKRKKNANKNLAPAAIGKGKNGLKKGGRGAK